MSCFENLGSPKSAQRLGMSLRKWKSYDSLPIWTFLHLNFGCPGISSSMRRLSSLVLWYDSPKFLTTYVSPLLAINMMLHSYVCTPSIASNLVTAVDNGPLFFAHCYITVGMFTQHGLSSKAMTLRSLSGVRGSEY